MSPEIAALVEAHAGASLAAASAIEDARFVHGSAVVDEALELTGRSLLSFSQALQCVRPRESEETVSRVVITIPFTVSSERMFHGDLTNSLFDELEQQGREIIEAQGFRPIVLRRTAVEQRYLIDSNVVVHCEWEIETDPLNERCEAVRVYGGLVGYDRDRDPVQLDSRHIQDIQDEIRNIIRSGSSWCAPDTREDLNSFSLMLGVAQRTPELHEAIDGLRQEGSVKFQGPCPDCGEPCEWIAYSYPPVPGWCSCQASGQDDNG